MAHTITTAEELERLVGDPSAPAVNKEINYLDEHCRDFIARSPLAMLATSDEVGRCDCSPRGGPPGFALVVDDLHVVLPDYTGNRRQDSHRNVLANPGVGLLFVLPGLRETLRVNGRGTLTTDPELLERLQTGGPAPKLALSVEVTEAYLHCSKAFVRSKTWDPSTWTPAEERPSPARVFSDHMATPDLSVAAVQQILETAERDELW